MRLPLHRPRAASPVSLAVLLSLMPTIAAAAILPGKVVVRIGDVPAGESDPVTSLNSPFTDGDGGVGFTGNLSGDNFVWHTDGIVWRNSDEQIESLTGAEATSGIGDKGRFIYSPSVSANDGVWTHNGLLAKRLQQAPGFPMGFVSTFHSRPAMTPVGDAFWISGFNEMGGTSTQGRMLYKAIDGDPATIEVVLRSDDVIGGLTVARPSGVSLDFAVSDDSVHVIQFVQFDTGESSNDGAIIVDKVILARESMPTGDGDNWAFFDTVSINNAGDWLISGDTDAANNDEFVAYNGVIGVREGDIVGGVQIPVGASVNGVSISNLGTALFQFTHASAEVLYYACDASDLASAQVAVMRTDEIDVDNDQVGDFVVTDLNASASIGPGFQLAEDGRIYVSVDLDDGVTNVAGILEIEAPSCCGDGKVLMGLEACDDGNADDTDECVSGCVLAACGDGFLQAGVESCDDGNDVDTDECPSSCVPAACGDGFVQDGVEGCDDGNDDDSDDCVSGCVLAACGDGFVQAGVEGCDDGNLEDGDGCSAECVDEGGTSTGTDTDGTTTDGTTTDGTTTDMTTTGVGTTDVSTTDVSTTDVTTTATSETTGPGTASDTGTGTSTTTTSTTATSATQGSSDSDTDTDTDDSGATSGGVIDDGGCGCRSDGAPLPGAPALLGFLALLGFSRRRR